MSKTIYGTVKLNTGYSLTGDITMYDSGYITVSGSSKYYPPHQVDLISEKDRPEEEQHI